MESGRIPNIDAILTDSFLLLYVVTCSIPVYEDTRVHLSIVLIRDVWSYYK